MNYLIFSLLAAVGYGFYNFFVGKTGGKITPFIGTLILSSVAILVALVVIVFTKFTGGKLYTTPDGIKFAVGAGLAVGIAEILYFSAFAKNQNVSVVLPIVFTVTVLTGVVLGFVFNQEPISAVKILGILFALIGLFLLGK